MSTSRKHQPERTARELARATLPDESLDGVDVDKWIEESSLTDKEFLAFVLSKATDKTAEERAEMMGSSEGRYWGALGRAKSKIGQAEYTLKLASV